MSPALENLDVEIDTSTFFIRRVFEFEKIKSYYNLLKKSNDIKYYS